MRVGNILQKSYVQELAFASLKHFSQVHRPPESLSRSFYWIGESGNYPVKSSMQEEAFASVKIFLKYIVPPNPCHDLLLDWRGWELSCKNVLCKIQTWQVWKIFLKCTVPRILLMIFYWIDEGGNYPVKMFYVRTSLGKCEIYSILHRHPNPCPDFLLDRWGWKLSCKKFYARTSLGKCEIYSSSAKSPRILVMIFVLDRWGWELSYYY